LFYWLNRKKQRIVNYHHVLPASGITANLVYGYAHSTDSFSRQLAVMRQRFELTTEWHKPGSLVVTFDDGALNNLTHAIPLLDALGVKAYFFVVHACCFSGQPLWIDQWYWWLSEVPAGVYWLGGREITIDTAASRWEANRQLTGALLRDYGQKAQLLEEMDQIWSFTRMHSDAQQYRERFAALQPDDLEAVKAGGHQVGYHSWAHDMLGALSETEFKQQLQQEYPNPAFNCSAYAIPFGTEAEVNQGVIDQLVSAGLQPVLLNEPFSRFQGALGRINLPDTTDAFEIHAYLSGLFHFMKFRKLL
ncbi:MAG: polysaccharide deacetylase family protein, partial [Bacteroidota bacterium]